MENPLSWNAAQKAIFEALCEHFQATEKHVEDGSQVYYIYNALKNKGFLKQDA